MKMRNTSLFPIEPISPRAARLSIILALMLGLVAMQARGQEGEKPAPRGIDVLLDRLYPNQPDRVKPIRKTSPTPSPAPQATPTSATLLIKLPNQEPLVVDANSPSSPTLPGIDLTTQTLRAHAADKATTGTSGRDKAKPKDKTRRTTDTHANALVPPAVTLPPTPLPSPKPVTSSVTAEGDQTTTGPLRVNVATARQIAQRLKIDSERARLIVEFRQLYGPFRTPADLDQVEGIHGDMVRQWESQNLLRFD